MKTKKTFFILAFAGMLGICSLYHLTGKAPDNSNQPISNKTEPPGNKGPVPKQQNEIVYSETPEKTTVKKDKIVSRELREKYNNQLKNHPFYSHHEEEMEVDADEFEKEESDHPELAYKQEFLRTMDPSLGRPAPERLSAVKSYIQRNASFKTAPGAASAPWVERGPNNIGGRVRALVYDPNDSTHKKVWAGGVSGGLWFNNDIANADSGWHLVNSLWPDLSVTCIAFDPNNPMIAYLGSGEMWGFRMAWRLRGDGILKTTDGGLTWTQLPASTGFEAVNDIMVRNESGTSVVYAAVDAGHTGAGPGAGNAGLQRSINGGTSFTQVLPNIAGQSRNYVAADIEIAANNRIWIGSQPHPDTSMANKGGGIILYSDNGTTWVKSDSVNVNAHYGRVEIACAPTSANVVYAIFEDSAKVKSMRKTVNGGTSWTNIMKPEDSGGGTPVEDFSRGQAWYDLAIAVDPNDAGTLVVGAIDFFRSQDSGSTWNQISQWYNWGESYSVVHSDHHVITFKPGSSTAVAFGGDGGIYYTSKLKAADTSDVISKRNKNLNITQFQACALHPEAGKNYYLAGSQDNGTQKFEASNMNATTEAFGGDGSFCFIDQNNPAFQIVSYVYNNFYLSGNGGGSFSQTISSGDQGQFTNPADYDDNLGILFSAETDSTISRVRGIKGSPEAQESIQITGMNSMANHLRVSPYSKTSTTLFIGTLAGSVYKITNANNVPSVQNITGSNFPLGSVSCIEIGNSENELLVTFFNYGVPSVWFTTNGGTTWVNKESNLPDMPVRWALINPSNINEVILATQVGIWATGNFNAASPTWAYSTNGMGNARVDMLKMRKSDMQIVAATYGRGLFTSNAFNIGNPPKANFRANKAYVCLNEVVNFTQTCGGDPTSFNWNIAPSTYVFVDSTNSSSANPHVSFTADGNYTITLKATNSFGSDSIIKNSLIKAGSTTLPFYEGFSDMNALSRWNISNPDNAISWNIGKVDSSSGNLAVFVDNYNYADIGQRDGLISPSINLTYYASANLSFRHAFRPYGDPMYYDSMAIYVSTDCGANWTRIRSYIETAADTPFTFATAYPSYDYFVPTHPDDWCGMPGYGSCINIDLSAYAGNKIKIKFENINSFGNGIYLDDVMVTGVSNQQMPVANFSASDSNVCISRTVTLSDKTSNNPNSWKWTITPSTFMFVNGTTGESQNPVIGFKNPGKYTVQLNAANTAGGNTIAKTDYLNVELNTMAIPTISRSNNLLTCNLTVSTYKWYRNGILIAGANQQSYTITQNGDYVVEAINASGCSQMSSSFKAIPTSVKEISSMEELRIYPNPSKGIFLVDFKQMVNSKLTFTVYDITGKVIYHNSMEPKMGANNFSINISEFPVGLYQLRIEDETSRLVKTLMVE